MPPNTRQSPMWEVFQRLENGYTKCMECDHLLKRSENTTNMWNHTKSKHPNKYLELVRKHKIKNAVPKQAAAMPSRVIAAVKPNVGIKPVPNIVQNMTVAQKKSRVSRSSVWEAFERLENGSTKCFECGIILKWREGTTTMWNHMRRKHLDRFNELFRKYRLIAPKQTNSAWTIQQNAKSAKPLGFTAPKITKIQPMASTAPMLPKLQPNAIKIAKPFTAPKTSLSVTTIQPKIETPAPLVKNVRLIRGVQRNVPIVQTSAVWKVFERLANGFTKCLQCGHIIKCLDYNTSNMWSHIKSTHIDIYKNIKQMKRQMTRKKLAVVKKPAAAVNIPVVVPGKCRLCVSTSATLRPDQLVMCFDTIDDELSVAYVLNQHFPFDPLVRELHSAAFVCLPCWGKVNAFHQFYQSVLTMHQIENNLSERMSPTTSKYFSADVDAAEASCSSNPEQMDRVELDEMPPLDIKAECISDDDEDEYSYYVHSSDKGAGAEQQIYENSAYSLDDYQTTNDQLDYADDTDYANDVVMSCEVMESMGYSANKPTIELTQLDIKTEPQFNRLAEAGTTSRTRPQIDGNVETNAPMRPPMLRWYGKVSDREKSKIHKSKFT